MQRGECQHIILHISSRNKGALDTQLSDQDAHVWDLEITSGDGERVDGSSRCHNGQKLLPVWLEGGGNQQVVNETSSLELSDVLGSDELSGAESERLFLLGVGGGEDGDGASLLGCELDGQVAETTDTDDADAVRGGTAELCQGVPDGGTTAHEGCGVLALDGVWDLEDIVGLPDTVGGEGSLVEVAVTVHDTLRAKSLVTGQALLAVTTSRVLVSPSDGVALLEVLYC